MKNIQKSIYIDSNIIENESNYIVKAYGTTFDNIDYQGDIITEKTFLESLDSKLPVYYEHKSSGLAIGEVTKIEQTDKGLLFNCEIPKNIGMSDSLIYNIKKGYMTDVSIGFSYNPANVETKHIDKKQVRVFHKADLKELSFTKKGANPEAKIIEVKHCTINDLESETANIKSILLKHYSDSFVKDFMEIINKNTEFSYENDFFTSLYNELKEKK